MRVPPGSTTESGLPASAQNRPVKSRKSFSSDTFRAALASLTRRQLRLFPIAGDIRNYGPVKLAADSRAAIQVALLAFPQGMIFALIAGLPLYHGIFACVAGLSLGAVFSGARHVSFGPSVTISVLLSSIFLQLGIAPAQRADAAAILMVMVAVFLIAGAWFRLALLTRFISRSVSTGFIIAAGLLIVASQLKHILGVPVPETGIFFRDLQLTFAALPETHWPTLLVGSITAGIYLAAKLKAPVVPAAAAAVIAGSVAGWFLNASGHAIQTVAGIGNVHLPDTIGDFRFEWVGVIANAAFAVALLSHLEVSLIGRPFAARAGDRFDANQHLFGLGMATLGNALFSGMPASISLARSRLNRRNHPATPLTGVLAALFCGSLFIACAPVIGDIPRSALAALAMALASEIFSRHYVQVILKTSYADAWVFAVTVASGLLFRLDVALYTGAGLSIVFFLRRVGVPELSEYEFTGEGKLAALKEKQIRPIPDISIVHVEGDLFFGAAEIFLEQARHMTDDPNLKVIILRMTNAHHLDATCALAIEEFLRFAADNDRHIIVSGAHREIYRVFRNSGLLQTIGRENFFMDTPSNPTRSTRNALKRAQALLGGVDANIRIYVNPSKEKAGNA